MIDEDELPAVYGSLSWAGLQNLRARYQSRFDASSHGVLRDSFERRLRFLDLELSKREAPAETPDG